MKYSLLTAFAILTCVGCTHTVTINIENPSSKEYADEVVAVDAREVAKRLGCGPWQVLSSAGLEVPSQLTSDSLLLILANIPANGRANYTVRQHEHADYDTLACGRIFHERMDDLGWENDFGGYRAYGPPLQASGEKGFGYDLFTKRGTNATILNRLYALEEDPTWWQKRNAFLETGDTVAADSVLIQHSYHIDKGYGMDCFAVGPTLGAGATALIVNDTVRYPWCWDQQRILDNGPLRFRALLAFQPDDVEGDKSTEVRDVTLDAGKRLNRTIVRYQDLASPHTIMAGFPLRDDGPTAADSAGRYFAYANPTLNLYPNIVSEQGRIFQGIITITPTDSIGVRTDGNLRHLAAFSQYKPGTCYEYMWGFAWDQAGLSWEEWLAYLEAEADALANPLKIIIE